MRKDPVSVKTDTPINDVAMTFEKYDLVAVPVIDSIGRLVGQITVDDIMDEVREQSEREYQLASGLSQDVESNDTVFTQTAARLPWLLIGMVGGLANSVILGNFESNIAKKSGHSTLHTTNRRYGRKCGNTIIGHRSTRFSER